MLLKIWGSIVADCTDASCPIRTRLLLLASRTPTLLGFSFAFSNAPYLSYKTLTCKNNFRVFQRTLSNCLIESSDKLSWKLEIYFCDLDIFLKFLLPHDFNNVLDIFDLLKLQNKIILSDILYGYLVMFQLLMRTHAYILIF